MIETVTKEIYQLCWFLLVLFTIYLIKKATSGTAYHGNERLDGKVVIVTGANSGIGFETALDVARRGAHVILACRDTRRGYQAECIIKEKTNNQNVKFRQLDLSSFESIHSFVQLIKQEEDEIFCLVNNAGVFWCPFARTQDGFELNFGVCHLGHVLLTILLLPLLKACAGGSRIVIVSSIMYIFVNLKLDKLMNQNEKNYNFVWAYSQSKLANVMFSLELAKSLRSENIKVSCVDPGVVSTDIGKTSSFMNSFIFKIILYPIIWLLFKSAKAGAQTSIFCICSDEVGGGDGCIYSECEMRTLYPSATVEEDSYNLWLESLRLVGLTEIEKESVTRN